MSLLLFTLANIYEGPPWTAALELLWGWTRSSCPGLYLSCQYNLSHVLSLIWDHCHLFHLGYCLLVPQIAVITTWGEAPFLQSPLRQGRRSEPVAQPHSMVLQFGNGGIFERIMLFTWYIFIDMQYKMVGESSSRSGR